jgi:hypothetical protein
MGKIYAPPKKVGPAPELRDFMINGRFDSEKMDEAEEKWINELKLWCAIHSSGKYVGEVIRQGVADGYAQYMVYSLRPLELIHLPLGDGYQFQWAHRWTAADVKSMIDREKKMQSLFKRA